MSTNISIFLKSNISKAEFYDFLSSIGGKKQYIGSMEQGVLDDGEATIWFYYRGDNFNLDTIEQVQLSRYMKSASTEIAIEIGSDDDSSLLAKRFCEKAVKRFGDLILLNEANRFFTIDEVKSALYIE